MFQSKQKSDDKVERGDSDVSFHTSQSITLPYPAAQKTLSLKVRKRCDTNCGSIARCLQHDSRVMLSVENQNSSFQLSCNCANLMLCNLLYIRSNLLPGN